MVVLKVASVAAGLAGTSLVQAASSATTIPDITNMIIAISGLVAATAAFVLGWRQRKEDPRDKLLEILLKERKEGIENDEEDYRASPRRRRRREQS